MNSPQNYISLAEETRSLIDQNKLNEVLDLLTKSLDGHPLYASILNLARKYQELTQKVVVPADTTEKEEKAHDKNKIVRSILQIVKELELEQINQTSIFICHSGIESDNDLVLDLSTHLSNKGFSVFLPEPLIAGEKINPGILEELETCDYFLVLISDYLNQDELRETWIQRISERREKNGGKPVILPVRIRLNPNSRLNKSMEKAFIGIKPFLWTTPSDTPALYEQLLEVLFIKQDAWVYSNGESEALLKEPIDSSKLISSLPIQLYEPVSPGGPISINDYFYICRTEEREYLEHPIAAQDVLRIKAPKQFGKTTLFNRIIFICSRFGIITIPISFNHFSKDSFSDLDHLLNQFCIQVLRRLNIPLTEMAFWGDPKHKLLTSKLKTTLFFEEKVLPLGKICLGIDEADQIFAYPEISNDFFSLLRDWIEMSRSPNSIWGKFSLLLSYSTEAKLAITDLNSSPFSIGDEIRLNFFKPEEIEELAKKHGLNWSGNQITKVMDMIDGHPYLVRKAMFLITKNRYSLADLLAAAPYADGPFGDHLRRLEWDFRQVPLNDILGKICRNESINDRELLYKLQAAGLTSGLEKDIRPALNLYRLYFGNGTNASGCSG